MAAVATVRKVRNRRPAWAAALSLLAVVVSLLVPPAAGPASGQSEDDRQRIDQQIDSYRGQVQEASAEEARLLAELDASAARKRELDAQVAAMDRDIGVAQRNLSAAESKLAAAEAEQRRTEARLAEAQEELEAARAKLRDYAIAAYTGQSDAARVLKVTFRAHSMGELVAKRSYMKAVATNQSEVISLDERLRDEVADLHGQLQVARDEAQDQRNVVADERSRLQGARDAQDEVRSQVAVEMARTDQVRGEVVARKAEFETQIAELEQESAAIEATLRQRAEEQRARAAAEAAAPPAAPGPPGEAGPAPAAPGAEPAPPSGGGGGLISPIPGAPITSPFGYRVHPIYGDSRLHTGVDMGASSGTPIRSAGDGVVVTAEWYGGYGNATIIDHGNGLATLYGHQSSIGVSAGQRVSQGQVIGRVGCTGSCTGPHLHFEVREDGTPVNPLNYI